MTELIHRRLREIDQRMSDLRRLRKDLRALAASAADFDPAECPPASVCRILNGGD